MISFRNSNTPWESWLMTIFLIMIIIHVHVHIHVQIYHHHHHPHHHHHHRNYKLQTTNYATNYKLQTTNYNTERRFLRRKGNTTLYPEYLTPFAFTISFTHSARFSTGPLDIGKGLHPWRFPIHCIHSCIDSNPLNKMQNSAREFATINW